MSEKVKLPKDVSDSIEWCRKHQHYTNYDILQRCMDGTFANTHAAVIKDFANREDGFDKLLQALVNGYEVEITPKEQAIQYLIKLNNDYKRYSEHDAITGIMQILGVK